MASGMSGVPREIFSLLMIREAVRLQHSGVMPGWREPGTASAIRKVIAKLAKHNIGNLFEILLIKMSEGDNLVNSVYKLRT